MRGFQPAGDKTLKKKSTGPVRGPGTGTSDDVQAQVQDGTYIMPTDSTQAIGEQNLAAMGKGAPVDVNLSNGEFKMPPEQVHAVGVQALDQMKNATHTPVAARGLPVPAQQPGEPPLFFVDGGEVDKNKRTAPSPTNIFPQSSPATGANIYSGVGFSADQFGSSGKLATVPNSIGQQPGRQPPAEPSASVQQGMTDTQREQAISQIPTGGVVSPSRPAPAQPIDLRTPPRGFSAGAVQPASQPLDAQAASDRAKIGAAWDTIKDVNNDAGRAIADVAMLAPRAVAGAYDSAVVRPMRAAGFNASYLSPSLVPNGVDPSSMTPYTDQKRMQQQAATAAPTVATAAAAPSAPAAATAPQATVDKPVDGGRGRINPPLANPSAPVPTSSQPTSTEIAPGVFRSGNSYSDSAAGAQSMQTRGLPSAQNMAAADALAQRSQQESMARLMAGQPSEQQERGWSGSIGQSSGNGNMWSRTPEQQRKDAETQASSIHQQTAFNGRAALAALNPQDLESMRGANALEQENARQAGELQRTTLREAGDTRRNALNNNTRLAEISARGFTEGVRNAIDQGRLNLDQQVRGFDIRAGQRQEKLYQRYEAAKTPEERSAIVQQIRDLSGKAEPTNRYTVVPGGQEWDATAGAMRNVPGRVLNNQTGQFVEQQGATSAQPAGIPKVGDTRDGYRYKGGNPNDKANWQKV